MKKCYFALSLGAVACVAQAQSSVTLYGIADAGFTYTSNAKGSRQYALTSGAENSSRWGLAGSEDLGGGLKAVFTLEAGFNIGNGTIGQNGTEFGRQAFVGVVSKYGTVTLGRQYSSTYQAVGPLTAGGDWAAPGAVYGAHPADADNLDSTNRTNNAVKYQSPDYRGFTFGGLYSFGGKAGQFSQNSIWDVSAAYANGPVKAGVGYVFVKDPNFSLWGNKANDSTSASNISNPIIAGYATAGSEQIVAAAVTYSLAAVSVGANYSNTQFQKLGSVNVAGVSSTVAGNRGTASFNTGELNLKYRPVPALLLGAAYSYTKNSGAEREGGARYQQVDLGAIYSLSKRTSLYAVAIHQIARGTDSTGGHAVADITGATPSATGSQTVVTVGLTHKF